MSNPLRTFASRLARLLSLAVSSENNRVRRNHPTVSFPPCELSLTALSHCDYRRYLDSGQAHAAFILQTIRAHSSSRHLTVCEWGCGPGRVIQHLNRPGNGISRLIGTDCDQDSINWCRRHLPAIEFQAHALQPPLALTSGSIDVIYCCAVFSHLAEPQHHAWIDEILRLLRPGGLLIATLNGSHYEDRMTVEERACCHAGGLAVRTGGPEGASDFVSFAGERFVRERLLNRFATVTRLDDAPFRQTVWAATTAYRA